MTRHDFISDNLDELAAVEQELEEGGLVRPQMHVLSDSEAEVSGRQRPSVSDFMKTDVVYCAVRGLLVGGIGAALVLAVSAFAGWAEGVGWAPFVFFAVVVLGFCAWEGGLLGFQEKNRRFRVFEGALNSRRHVFFVDVGRGQEAILSRVCSRHPVLIAAGDGKALPAWLMISEQQLRNFVRWGP